MRGLKSKKSKMLKMPKASKNPKNTKESNASNTLKVVAAISFLITVLAVSGCGNKVQTVIEDEKESTINFSWWGVDLRHEYTLEGIGIFEEQNPSIDVLCSYGEWNGFKTKMDLQKASHTLPDILQINYSWLEDYSGDENSFYDLTKLSKEIDLDNYTKEELEYGTMDDKLYALPIAMNSGVMCYNKTIYDAYNLEIPTTWEDLFVAAKTMRKDHVYPMSGDFQHIFYMLVSYTEQETGKEYMDKDGNVQFDAEDMKILLNFYKRLIDEKVIPHSENFDRLHIEQKQYAGNMTWISDTEKYFQTLKDAGQEIVIGNYLTHKNGDKKLGWYYKPATMYAINGRTKHEKESAVLLNYLVNSKDMALLQGVEKGVPVSKAAYDAIKEDGKLEGLQYNAYEKMKANQSKMNLVSCSFEDSDRMNSYRMISDEYIYDQEKVEETAGKMLAVK